ATAYKRNALVQIFGRDIQDSSGSIGGLSAGLFGQKGDGIGLVEQPKFSVFVFGALWVKIDPTLNQVSMKIRDQRADVSAGIGAIALLFLAVFDVFFDALRKIPVVAFVDRVRLPRF